MYNNAYFNVKLLTKMNEKETKVA